MTHAQTFGFGAYVLIPRRQLLLKNGRALRIGSRALDLLAAFVQRPGEVLSKRELLEKAWPSTTVVEGNLKVHIAALRRALDDDAHLATYIATVNGRGYRFIAPVEVGEASAVSVVDAQPSPLVGEETLARGSPLEAQYRDVVVLLMRATRSGVVDLHGEAGGRERLSSPRRILFIELTAADEAWIEDLLARQGRSISTTQSVADIGRRQP